MRGKYIVTKIFSGSNIEALKEQIQNWLDEMEELAFDAKQEFQIISVTQSEADEIINITIIAK